MAPKLRQIQNVSAHDDVIETISIGQRTGQVFGTGGKDRYLHLWNIGNNNPRASFGPFQSVIQAITFNIEEDKILSGNRSGAVLLFDLNESRCASNWTAHHSGVKGMCFYPQNPKMVVTCGADGAIKILSTQQRTPVQSYNAHDGSANYIACSADGRLIATAGDDMTVRLFDITAQRQLVKFEGHCDKVTCVQFHPEEKIIISCSADRSIKFWDYEKEKEINVNFPLDSSPVNMVRFVQGENVAISASSDYIKIVGWKPPEFFDHFTLGLDVVHDFSIADQMLTIASSCNEKALIHRMRLSQLKPFSLRPQQTVQFASEQSNKQKNHTQRLLDISTMPQLKPGSTNSNISKKLTKKSKELSSVSSNGSNSYNEKNDSSSNASVSSSGRSTKASNKRGKNIQHAYEPPLTEEQRIFRDFRKSRGSFMSSMNEKFSRLIKIKEMLSELGLTKTLETVAENGDLGLELLAILRNKPEVVKLKHSASMMEICVKIFDKDYDIAISIAELMLQAYGKLVNATWQTASNGVGMDVALEERKRKSEKFVESFRALAPKLRTVTFGKSNASQTASELLEEWKVFLR